MQQAASISLIALAAAATGGIFLFLQADGQADTGGAGERIDAIGDSITRGIPLEFELDASGKVRHSETVHPGWPGLLDHLISTSSPGNGTVRNLGVPGAKVSQLLARHPRRFFGRRLDTTTALVTIGTNDSNPDVRTPSGLGCDGDECDGTYAGFLTRFILNLQSSGVETIYVAQLPPIWGEQTGDVFADPLADSAARNTLVQEYNQVIREQIVGEPGVELGPDFFSCFLSRQRDYFSLFEDVLHPNKLGYVVMAALWRDTLTGARATGEECDRVVYLVNGIDARRFGHQQTLVAAGDRYYTDTGHVVAEMPDELVDGIWIIQPNANRDNAERDYLEFDTGDEPVDVYIAYDPAGRPPFSASHEFLPVSLAAPLRVTDPQVRQFALLRAANVTGRVSIGGTASSGPTEGQQAYTTIVVP